MRRQLLGEPCLARTGLDRAEALGNLFDDLRHRNEAATSAKLSMLTREVAGLQRVAGSHPVKGRQRVKGRRRSPDLDHVSKSVSAAASLALAAQLLLSGAPAARAQAGQTCDADRSSAPVLLLILQSSKKVHDFAASVRGAKILKQDQATVIFSDGRVVTSNIEAATRHLNELRWGSRSIQIVASFPTRRSRRRSFG